MKGAVSQRRQQSYMARNIFPAHGLRYSVAEGFDTHKKEMDYLKVLVERDYDLLKAQVSPDDSVGDITGQEALKEIVSKGVRKGFSEKESLFKNYFEFKLNGIDDNLAKITNYYDGLTVDVIKQSVNSKATASGRASNVIRKSVVNQCISLPEGESLRNEIKSAVSKGISGKILNLIRDLDSKDENGKAVINNKESLDALLNNQKHRDVKDFLEVFLEKNSKQLEHAPTNFCIRALKAELMLLKSQFFTLEVKNKKRGTNIELLDQEETRYKEAKVISQAEKASYIDGRNKMLRFVTSKREDLTGKILNLIEELDLKDGNEKALIDNKGSLDVLLSDEKYRDVKGFLKGFLKKDFPRDFPKGTTFESYIKALKVELGQYESKVRFVPLQQDHDKTTEFVLNAATEQFKALLSGSMSVALKDPATRKFKSRIKRVPDFQDTISESQYDALRDIESAIINGGGKVKIRMATGTGKTRLLEDFVPRLFVEDSQKQSSDLSPSRLGSSLPVLPHKISHLDLNSSEADFENIARISSGKKKDLTGEMIILDEEFFYHRHFLKKQGLDSKNKVEIEKYKNDFIVGLEARGAIIITSGASESLDRIDYEKRRTANKIAEEKAMIIAKTRGSEIEESLGFLSPKLPGTADEKGLPLFQRIFSKELEVLSRGKDLIVKSSNWANSATIEDNSDAAKKEKTLKRRFDGSGFCVQGLKGNPGPDVNKREFLAITAYYIKKLSEINSEISKNGEELRGFTDSIESLKNALTLEPPSGHRKSDKKNNSFDLKTLIKVANNERTKDLGTIDKDKLMTAVYNFIKDGYLDKLIQVNSGKVSVDGEMVVVVGRLEYLEDKLKTRSYEYDDLYKRREDTKKRFDDSKIVGDSSYNVEELIFLRDKAIKESEEAGSAEIKSSVLFEVVKNVLRNPSSKLEQGQKMQYILPDFDINDKTYGEDGARDIVREFADIVIAPHKHENGRVVFRVSYGGAKGLLGEIITHHKDDEVAKNERMDIDLALIRAQEAIASEVSNPRVISFFDEKNAIGGDYGTAGLGIDKQYIHLTKDGYLDREDDALTWNLMMQYNRNRSDPETVIDLDWKVILPNGSIERAFDALRSLSDKGARDFSEMLVADSKENLKKFIEWNTKKDDKLHLDGIKESKVGRNGKEGVFDYVENREKEGVLDYVEDREAVSEEKLDEEVTIFRRTSLNPMVTDRRLRKVSAYFNLMKVEGTEDRWNYEREVDQDLDSENGDEFSQGGDDKISGGEMRAVHSTGISQNTPAKKSYNGFFGDIASLVRSAGSLLGLSGHKSEEKSVKKDETDLANTGKFTLSQGSNRRPDEEEQSPHNLADDFSSPSSDRKTPYQVVGHTSQLNTVPQGEDHLEYKRETKSPHSSPLQGEASQLVLANKFVSYSYKPTEPSYRKEGENQGHNLVVYKDVYKEETLISNTIFNIIIKTAEDLGFDKEKTKRVIEYSRMRGGVLFGQDTKVFKSNKYDIENFEEYKSFVKNFQSLCKECGIHAYLGKSQGLRLCDIPNEVTKRVDEHLLSRHDKDYEIMVSKANKDIEKRISKTKNVKSEFSLEGSSLQSL